MALEETGMYFRSLSQYQQEPFDLTFNKDTLPTAGDVAMMPVKVSLGYNLMRSAWWGSKAIGMNPFSRMTNPFNPSHLQWRYRAKSMKGFSSRILEGIGTTVGNTRSWMFGTVKEGTEQAIPWYRRAVYSMEKDNALIKEISQGKGGTSAVKSMGLGALDRYLLRPNEMHNRMAKVHSAFRTAVTADELGETMLANLYEASPRRGASLSIRNTLTQTGKYSPTTLAEEAALKDVFGGRRHVNRLGSYLEHAGLPTDVGNLIEQSPLVPEGSTLEDFVKGGRKYGYKRGFIEGGRKDFLRASRGSKVSVFDLISGKGQGFEKRIGEGFFKSRWRYAKETINFGYDDDTRKKLTLWHSRNRNIRKYSQQFMMAHDKTYQDLAIKAAKQSSDDLAQQFKLYTEIMDNAGDASKMAQKEMFRSYGSLKYPRMIKAGLGVATGLAAGAWLTKTLVQGALTLPGRIAMTMGQMTRAEFGSGEVISNSRVSTERQRAVQAIQNAHMNARYLLGSEAGMYH